MRVKYLILILVLAPAMWYICQDNPVDNTELNLVLNQRDSIMLYEIHEDSLQAIEYRRLMDSCVHHYKRADSVRKWKYVHKRRRIKIPIIVETDSLPDSVKSTSAF